MMRPPLRYATAPLQRLLAPLCLLPLALAVPTAIAGTGVLYDQSTPGDGGASPTQHTGTVADEIADDFNVSAPGWTVTELRFAVNFTDPDSTPPGQPPYHVAIYPDSSGSPGPTAVCSEAAAPGVTDAAAPGGELNATVVLPTPCTLPPGRYWLAMSVVLAPPPYSLWGYVADAQPILSEPVYRNPGNAYGTGCIDWTPAYSNNCLFNPSGGSPHMMFQIRGTPAGTADAIFADGFVA